MCSDSLKRSGTSGWNCLAIVGSRGALVHGVGVSLRQMSLKICEICCVPSPQNCVIGTLVAGRTGGGGGCIAKAWGRKQKYLGD